MKARSLGIAVAALLAAAPVGAGTGDAAAGSPSGAVWLMTPPALRRGELEVDGQPAGTLPAKPLVALPPGGHKLAVGKGRLRVSADVTVRAGIEMVVRWPRPDAPQIVYTPTMGLIVEAAEGAAGLRKSAADSIHRLRYAVLGEHGTPTAAASVMPAACGESASCLEELATAHGLRHVLAVSQTAGTEGPTVRARLFDAETGDIAAEGARDCGGCTAAQAEAALGALCGDVLGRGTTRKLGLLEITSQPSGAEVLIDGRRLGTTPYRRSVGAGEHEIVLHRTGFVDYQNSVDVEPGRGSAIDAVLRPDAPPPPPPQQPPSSQRRTTTKRL